MKLNDLPPNLRAQVDAKLGTSAKKKRTTQRGQSDVCEASCHGCGERFDRVSKWEAHSDASGHRRLDATL